MTDLGLIYVIGKEEGLTEIEMAAVYEEISSTFSHDIFYPKGYGFVIEVEMVRRKCKEIKDEPSS